MVTSILCRFKLTGLDFDPDDVAPRVGLKPTETWRVGDQVQRTLIRMNHSGVMWALGVQESLDVGAQISTLLEWLAPFLPQINDVRSEYQLDAQVSCEIWIGDTTPSVHFDRELLRKIDGLEAAVDIDMHVLPDGE